MRILAALACLTMSAAATAQDINAVSSRTGIVSNFDLPTITGILRELKVQHNVAPGSNGRFVNVAFENGIRATLGRSACRNNLQSCKGLTISARFGQGKPGWSELEKMRRVNSFNYRHGFIKAGLDANGNFYLSRYELNDFGVSRGAVATSLLVFANIGAKFNEHLKSETV